MARKILQTSGTDVTDAVAGRADMMPVVGLGLAVLKQDLGRCTADDGNHEGDGVHQGGQRAPSRLEWSRFAGPWRSLCASMPNHYGCRHGIPAAQGSCVCIACRVRVVNSCAQFMIVRPVSAPSEQRRPEREHDADASEFGKRELPTLTERALGNHESCQPYLSTACTGRYVTAQFS